MKQPYQPARIQDAAQAPHNSVAQQTQAPGPETARPDPELVAALSGLDAHRDMALSNRTRRAVHNAADDLQEGRHLRRRSFGIVFLTLIGLLTLLSPAIWNMVDELVGGEFLLDLPGIVAALALTLFAAVAAVLFLIGGDRGLRHSRR